MEHIKIFNVGVSNIKPALIRAGYPMATIINEEMQFDKRSVEEILAQKPVLCKLGQAPLSMGHDKYLRHIHCDFDVCAPRYWWQQMMTYGFISTNSQSTMHKGKSLDYRFLANKYVDPSLLYRFEEIVSDYETNPTEENFLRLKANLPEGIRITSAISTNYAELKTIYAQRHDHRLPEWREFCEWIKTLPYSKQMGLWH